MLADNNTVLLITNATRTNFGRDSIIRNLWKIYLNMVLEIKLLSIPVAVVWNEML